MLYGGHKRPVSALAEYVLNIINLGLEPGYKISWDDVVIRTPWMSKRLQGMTSEEERKVHCQPIPVEGLSLELEVMLERPYSEHILSAPLGKAKSPKEKSSTPTALVSKPPGLTKLGQGEGLRLHLKESTQGPGWTHVESKAPGPDVGCLYQIPHEVP